MEPLREAPSAGTRCQASPHTLLAQPDYASRRYFVLPARSIRKLLSIGGFLFAALLNLTASGSDHYLSHVGPPPLRFAPLADPMHRFAWPVPLVATNSTTNSVETTISSTTNATVATATSPNPQTNRTEIATTSEIPGTPSIPFGLEPIALGPETNILSASNLLNITPQMLADYFRATLESTLRSSTNAYNGPEVPFNPPTPKPPVPSSEAIYQVK